MLRLLGNLVAPAGHRAKLGIFGFHSVKVDPDPLDEGLRAERFERYVAFLRHEFNVLPLGEAFARLARGTLPARALSITFDDGYADNEEIVLPILKRLGVRATFFVSPGFSYGGIMFNDAVTEAVRTAAPGAYDLSGLGLGICEISDTPSRAAASARLIATLKYRPPAERRSLSEEIVRISGVNLPRGLMMRPAQIRHLHEEGMEIGAHTMNHPILAVIDEDEARAEIVGSKRRLEEITGAPVTLFAYPNGKPGPDYGPRDVRLVREAGFTAAVSTLDGMARRDDDPFQLPRLSAWSRNPTELGVRLLVSYARGEKR